MILQRIIVVSMLFWLGVAAAGIVKMDAESGKCGCCPKCCYCICKEKKMPECQNKLELCMLQDSSGSIQPPDWMDSKEFLVNVLDQFTNIEAKTAHISYSTTANLTWNLGTALGMNTDAAKAVLMTLTQFESLATNPVAAFQLMMSAVFNGNDDPAVENVALIVTDGQANINEDILSQVVMDEVHKYVRVVVIGVGQNVNMTELLLMASEPKSENVLSVPSSDDLKNFVADAVTRLCPDPVNATDDCFCCCPPPKPFAYLKSSPVAHHYGSPYHYGRPYNYGRPHHYGGPVTPYHGGPPPMMRYGRQVNYGY